MTKSLLSAVGLCFFSFPATASSLVSSTTITTSSATPVGDWRTVQNGAFAPGESQTFLISWGGVTAGRASLSVKEITMLRGRAVYHLIASANSARAVDTFYKVHDQNESWLDVASLTSLRFERHIREGSYGIEETTDIDQGAHRFAMHSYREDRNANEDKAGDVPSGVLDVLGSFYYIRTAALEVGKSYTMDVLSSEKVWPLVVNVLRKETIDVPAGTFQCILVEPMMRQPGIFIAKGKKLEVWLTDDSRHMPVRMRAEVFIGHVSADLTSFKTNALSN